MSSNKKPERINLTTSVVNKSVYHFYDSNCVPVHKAIEIFETENRIVIYPYYLDPVTKLVKLKKYESLEFIGWNNILDLPSHFKKKFGDDTYYDFQSIHSKKILKHLLSQFKGLNKIIISLHGESKLNGRTLTLNWPILEGQIKMVQAQKTQNTRYEKHLLSELFYTLDSKLPRPILVAKTGELDWFISQFTSWEKFGTKDSNALTKLISDLPISKISVTQHFIETQAKISTAYLENILKEFEDLRNVSKDNEKDWQTFFATNSWIFNHLFPFEVILRDKEAYVGGKTLSNKDGKVVDFLLENGFNDNFALIEIKTHKKELLKSKPYRGADVFSMAEDLSGGISQALDQKNVFMSDFGQKETILDPKCILIIGMKSKLTTQQRKCFELIRGNQKNIDIVTFDELELKIKGLHKVINAKV